MLDALRYQKLLVVVPNPELMDGHQEELAGELERQGYCVKGELGELEKAVERVLGGEGRRWGKEGREERGLQEVVDVEMGLVGVD